MKTIAAAAAATTTTTISARLQNNVVAAQEEGRSVTMSSLLMSKCHMHQLLESVSPLAV